MDKKEIYRHVDHSLLKPEATWQQVEELCRQGIEYDMAAVCINPVFVKRAVEFMEGKKPVCTVIGFPLGASTISCKVHEAKKAIEDGAQEIDMVIGIGALKSGDLHYMREEIAAVRRVSEGRILKVIVETCLLTNEEKLIMCNIVRDCEADYIKTSTGFSTGGATFEDVRLFVENAGKRLKVKASGGISTVEEMEKFLALGADRLGMSAAVKLLENM